MDPPPFQWHALRKLPSFFISDAMDFSRYKASNFSAAVYKYFDFSEDVLFDRKTCEITL
jgi:hypothetical protein